MLYSPAGLCVLVVSAMGLTVTLFTLTSVCVDTVRSIKIQFPNSKNEDARTLSVIDCNNHVMVYI